MKKNKITSPGIISIISDKSINALDLETIGGAVLVEVGESFNVPYKVVLNSTGSNFLKNDLNLNSANGDLAIQSNNTLIIDPKKHQLSAVGDIEIISKNGELKFIGYGGDNGSGSEKVVDLKTENGSITLQGEKIEIQGSKFNSLGDISILSTRNDLIVSGVRNNIKGSINIIENILQKIKIKDQELSNSPGYKDFVEKFNAIAFQYLQDGSENIKTPTELEEYINDGLYKLNNYILLNYPDFVYENTKNSSEKNYYKDVLNNLNSGNFTGVQNLGSILLSRKGDIKLISNQGVAISGSELNSFNGYIDIEAKGVLEDFEHEISGKYNNNLSSVKQGKLKSSIIIDSLYDYYEQGLLSDDNYLWFSPLRNSYINGNNGIFIKTKGDSFNNNLILQGALLSSYNGDVNIESNKNIIFDVAVKHKYDKSKKIETKRKWYGKKTVTTTLNTSEKSQGDSVNIYANNINILSSGVNTENLPVTERNSIDFYSTVLSNISLNNNAKKINIRASGDINFLTANDISLTTNDITKKSSFVGIKYNDSKVTRTSNIISEVPSYLEANYIGVKSGFDTRLVGTEFQYLDGAVIEAGKKIILEGASTRIEETLKKESNSVVWQSMQDKGSITETAKLPSFNGPTPSTFKAEGGMEVQIPIGEKDQHKVQIKEEIIKLANKPGNEYLNELVKRDDVNWNKVILTQQEWDYKSQGLTGPGAALVVLIVASLTSGAGTAAASTFGGGAATKAAVATIASQTSVSLINNGGDISKTLKDLGSNESIKGLVTSVVTAGLLSEVGTILNIKPNPLLFSDRLIQNFTNSIGSTLVQTAVNGGDLKDNLEKALLAGLAGALQGELAQNIKPLEDVNYLVHKFAHAAAGCIAGEIQRSCEAGAMGAFVGEVTADFVPRNKEIKDMSRQERNEYNKKVIDTTKLIAGIVSAYSGYDVNIAANSAETAVKNNFLYPKQKTIYELEYVGCSLKSDSEACRDNLVQEYMTLSKQNDQTLIDTCTNNSLYSACNSMIKVALDYSSSDFWYSKAPTTSTALNKLKIDQIRTRDFILSKIIESPDSFYKAVNDIDTRADFFSAMYLKTGAKWFLAAEQVSRNDLSGLMFNLGAEYDRTLQTVLAAFKNEYGTQTTLSQWRSEAGDAIMKLGYEDFKNVYQNYQTIDLKQWSIQRLVDEQVALQSIHEKYVSKLAPPLRLIMQGKAKIENILNVQDRIDKGCVDMGYEAKCGVSK